MFVGMFHDPLPYTCTTLVVLFDLVTLIPIWRGVHVMNLLPASSCLVKFGVLTLVTIKQYL